MNFTDRVTGFIPVGPYLMRALGATSAIWGLLLLCFHVYSSPLLITVESAFPNKLPSGIHLLSQT
jgi:hypothetical protein